MAPAPLALPSPAPVLRNHTLTASLETINYHCIVYGPVGGGAVAQPCAASAARSACDVSSSAS